MEKTFAIFICATVLFFTSCDDLSWTYAPVKVAVIVKADDLGDTTANWNRFIEIINENEICASIGIIAGNVATEGSIQEIKRIAALRQKKNNFPVIEFWNHGFDHSKTKHTTEFFGTDYNYQLEHLKKTQDFFTQKLGLTSHSFGAPFNKSTAETVSALDNFPEINIWQCYAKTEEAHTTKWKDSKKKKIRDSDEQIMLSVDYLSLRDFNSYKITNNYDIDKKKPYILIQVHPNVWGDENFKEFRRLIRFFKENNKGTFMTPYQYYQYLHGTRSM